MNWLKAIFKRKKREIIQACDCGLCHDSGVVRIPTGNKHFKGPDIFRECPNKCKLTSYGRMKIGLTY